MHSSLRAHMNIVRSLVVFVVCFAFLVVGSSVTLTAHATSSSGPIRVKQPGWFMFSYDPQHSHYNPKESMLSPQPVPNLVLDWNKATGSELDSVPAEVNGLLYIGN